MSPIILLSDGMLKNTLRFDLFYDRMQVEACMRETSRMEIAKAMVH